MRPRISNVRYVPPIVRDNRREHRSHRHCVELRAQPRRGEARQPTRDIHQRVLAGVFRQRRARPTTSRKARTTTGCTAARKSSSAARSPSRAARASLVKADRCSTTTKEARYAGRFTREHDPAASPKPRGPAMDSLGKASHARARLSPMRCAYTAQPSRKGGAALRESHGGAQLVCARCAHTRAQANVLQRQRRDGLLKMWRFPGRISRSPLRDSNPGPPPYHGGALPLS